MRDLRRSLREANVETVENLLRLKIFKIELHILIIATIIGIYTVVFSYFSIMKHQSFGTYAWDLGIFNQALWTTLNDGRFFYYTCELLINPSGSFFGIHFSPILFVVLPFYAIHPTPQTLLVLQSFVLALGAIPLYCLAVNELKYRVAGLVFVLTYLLYPPLQGINWFDFHVQSFLPLFFFSTLLFLKRQNWKIYFFFVVLSLMVEEHASMIVMFIGVFGLLHNRKQYWPIKTLTGFRSKVFLVPIITIILSTMWYIMTLWVRDSVFQINPNFLYEFNAAANWSVLGVSDPIMVPLHILLFPARAIKALGFDFLIKISYLLILFGPLALKPLGSVKYLVPTMPWFVLMLFSNYQPYYNIFNQYPAYIVAFIFVAAIVTISRRCDDLRTMRKPLITVFLCSLVASILVSPLSPIVTIVYPEHGVKPFNQHDEFIHEVITYIPSDASIITQSSLFPHISSRSNAFVIPFIHQIWREKVQEFTNFTNETLRNVDYIFVDFKTDTSSSELVFSLLQNTDEFGVLVSADSIILFKKGFKGKGELLAPFRTRYYHYDFHLYNARILKDPNSTSEEVVYFGGSLGSSPISWFSRRSLLPPGTYNVTLKFRVNTTSGTNEMFTVEICSNSGQNILASRTFQNDNLKNNTTWRSETVNFTVTRPLSDFEVRAVNVSEQVGILLDYIEIEQVDYENP